MCEQCDNVRLNILFSHYDDYYLRTSRKVCGVKHDRELFTLLRKDYLVTVV
jgi:hypothetical protein